MIVKTFADALKITASKSRVLLLGNGFSRALFDDIFSYDSILNRADFSKLSSSVKSAFEALSTTDFEQVIKTLQDMSKLIELYSDNIEIQKILQSDAEGLKAVLVETLAANHPEDPSAISEVQYKACRDFLSYFKKTYTLNYDLLLYWVYMHFSEDKDLKLNFNDGFLHPEGEDDSTYVVWGEARPYGETIYYLHGALHLFNSEEYLKKYTWSRTGVKLKEQINEALDNNFFPLAIAEGESKQKYGKIRQNDYLSKCYRSLRTAGSGSPIFTFGMSMGDNDNHILDAIVKSDVKDLWVGIYSPLESSSGKALQTKLNGLAERRHVRKPLKINYFDAKTADVWGPKEQ